MCCKGMAQPMRRDPGADTRVHNPPLQYHLDAASRQPTAAKIDDHRPIWLPCYRHRAPPGKERIKRRLAERHQPILVALARSHHDHPELFIDIAPVETDQLTDPQPSRVERFENRTIAHGRRRGVTRRNFYQPPHFVLLQNRRQSPHVLRRSDRSGRTRLADSSFAIAKKCLDRTQSALDGCTRLTFFHQFSQVAADMIRRDFRQIDLIDPTTNKSCSREQKSSERQQVAAIVDHGVLRGPRRLLKRRPKCRYLRPHHLACTHLSRYAISAEQHDKAWL